MFGRQSKLIHPKDAPDREGSRKPPSGARCRRETMEYVVANKLGTSGILTFDDSRLEQLALGSIDMMHQFSLLMKHLRRQVDASFPYTAVPEFSSSGRAHIHFMLPYDFPYVLVKEKWSVNGKALHRIIPTMQRLKKYGFYLGKDFDKPEWERPTKRRVFSAQGFKPEPLPSVVMTYGQAEQLAKEYALANGTAVTEIRSSKPWLRGGFTWLE